MRTLLCRFNAMTGWLCLLGALAIGTPLFICMPLWVDTTYHDLSARNIIWGGIHYRDIFETNLPGMVWLHVLIRPIIGWSSEAIRAVDMGVVIASVTLLGAWLRRVGISRSALGWFVAAAVFFYLFETEFIHCQRDGWMLLPTVVAMHLRGRQLARAPWASEQRIFWLAGLEGIAWGCAIWIKPHALVPALFLYLTGVRRLAGLCQRQALFDLLGLLTGGLLVGGAGSAWLVLTGTWPHMWDVLLNWNGEYYKWTPEELDQRASMVIMYFAPWSLMHLVALPLAVVALVQGRIWYWGDDPKLTPVRLDRAVLASLYLGWFTEAVFLQKSFHYSQAPVILVALALLAAYRLPVGQIFIGWCLIGATLNDCRLSSDSYEWLDQFKERKPYTYQQVVPTHRLINDRWYEVWWACVQNGSSPEMKDRLSFYKNIHCAPTWAELAQTKEFLQSLNLRDGQLVCWDDTTHPLYLDLGIRPGIRFMHVNTALDFRSKRPLIRQELIASGHKYVVSDMAVINSMYGFFPLDAPPGHPLDLPAEFPCFCRDIYPWDQPVIARFGRYWVHRVENPIGAIRTPYPLLLDKQ